MLPPPMSITAVGLRIGVGVRVGTGVSVGVGVRVGSGVSVGSSVLVGSAGEMGVFSAAVPFRSGVSPVMVVDGVISWLLVGLARSGGGPPKAPVSGVRGGVGVSMSGDADSAAACSWAAVGAGVD